MIRHYRKGLYGAYRKLFKGLDGDIMARGRPRKFSREYILAMKPVSSGISERHMGQDNSIYANE